MALGLVGAAASSCGGRTSSDQSSDAAADGGGNPLGPDGCVSESGYIACRGLNDCPTQSAACLQCFGDPDATGLCGTASMAGMGSQYCPVCSDNVCVELYATQDSYLCLPFDVGQLFAQNGSANRVRYTDWSPWSGEPLPEPSDCGDAGLPLCGGLCGPCAQGAICTGRSPLHPYGFCVPSTWTACTRSNPHCDASDAGCFIFSDPPDAQAIADDNGLCLPTSQCQALGGGYPGGGTCVSDD